MARRSFSLENRTAELRRVAMVALEPVTADPIRCHTLRRITMGTRHIAREGIGIEQRRVELLAEVARQQAIVAARATEPGVDPRPIAAPGSFLALLRKHVATGRFRPAAAHPSVTIGH